MVTGVMKVEAMAMMMGQAFLYLPCEGLRCCGGSVQLNWEMRGRLKTSSADLSMKLMTLVMMATMMMMMAVVVRVVSVVKKRVLKEKGVLLRWKLSTTTTMAMKLMHLC